MSALFSMIQPDTDDISLLHKIVDRNQAAVSILYDRYARIIYTIAYKILGSKEESEEIVIDVFNQVWKTSASYNPDKSRVDTWLFMIARSRALDRLRSLGRKTKVHLACADAAVLSPHASTPDEHLLIVERCNRLKTALDRLPNAQKEVLELAYYNGLTHAEIAATTGKSLGTVKTRIRLGLSKLKSILEPEI
jgi:RNA polymerase sigma factor (sigma-70 family)